MKNFVKCVLASVVAVAASCAMAQPAENNHAGYLVRGMIAKTNGVKAMLYPPTDITVINATNDLIYLSIPIPNKRPMVTLMNPGPNNYNPAHVTNPYGAFNTTLYLLDPYSNNILGSPDNTYCPRSVIIVFGGYGSYDVSVDEEYCR